MRKPWLYPLPAMAAALICAAPRANADVLTLSLTSPGQSALAGQIVPFSATLTAPCANTGADSLLGDSSNVSSPLSIDDSSFFFAWPVSLNSCDSVDNQLLFNVDVPSGAAPNLYTGTFTLVGMDSMGNTVLSNTVDFNVAVLASVSSVPEPPAFLLLGSGLIVLGVMAALGVGKSRGG